MRHHGRLCKKIPVDGTAAGDILSWDGDSWEPVDILTLISEIEDGTTAGQMLFWDGTKWVHTETTEIYWNDTTKVLTVAAGLIVTGNSVFGLNSSVFQPATDSTTFFQVLDADGGTPIFNVDTTNEIVSSPTFNALDEDNILQVDGTTILKIGISSLFIGENAGTVAAGGNSNVAIGKDAGSSLEAGGVRNVFIGEGAGTSVTSGDENFGIGRDSLASLTTGSNCVGIGAESLGLVTNNGNIGIGARAGQKGGSFNVSIGSEAGRHNTADNTICIGRKAGQGISGQTDSDKSVYIGTMSAFRITSGNSNVFLGNEAGSRQTTNSDLLIIDNQDRGSAAAEITDCLICGVFDDTVTTQFIRFNVGDLTLASGTPYQTLWNTTHEDSDGGRESRLNFKGEQSGGEETTLARIEVGHDGSADDEKGFIDGYTNSGSDGDSPTKQIRIQSTGDWVINKTSGIGIKVDLSAPTFGWRDLLGQIRTRGVGGTDPNDATYIGNIKAYQFAVNDECWVDYHIPHDYVPGTDIFLHFHWSHNSADVTGGSVTWGADITYAKGHNQAAFPATVNTTIVGNASTTQYQHIITEIQVSASSPSANQIDTDDLEPDGVIMIRGYLSANNITSSGAVPDPFLHFKDIHYQSTNLATKQKAPDFYT